MVITVILSIFFHGQFFALRIYIYNNNNIFNLTSFAPNRAWLTASCIEGNSHSFPHSSKNPALSNMSRFSSVHGRCPRKDIMLIINRSHDSRLTLIGHDNRHHMTGMWHSLVMEANSTCTPTPLKSITTWKGRVSCAGSEGRKLHHTQTKKDSYSTSVWVFIVYTCNM